MKWSMNIFFLAKLTFQNSISKLVSQNSINGLIFQNPIYYLILRSQKYWKRKRVNNHQSKIETSKLFESKPTSLPSVYDF